MMTGAPEEEEMMTEVEGEAWMMGHIVVVMTPNPGSPWADLVVGVSGRRPERRAGVLPVVTTVMTKMLLKERKDPAAASETVAHKERKIAGGEHPQTKEAPGETLAERMLTAKIDVTVKIVVIETAAIETAGMTVKTEAHKEIRMKEVLGVVEAMIRGRSGTGSVPERETGSASVKLMEKGAGVLTKKTLIAPRMRQMMMAGPLSAAEQ